MRPRGAAEAGTGAAEVGMKRSLKGALLSGLILPGVGQIWLRRYLRGIALICAVCVSLAAVMFRAAHQAFIILERTEAAGGAVDMVAILDTAKRASSAANDATTRWAMVIMALAWVIGVADAYLTGRKEDQAAARRGPPLAEQDRPRAGA